MGQGSREAEKYGRRVRRKQGGMGGCMEGGKQGSREAGRYGRRYGAG